MTQEEKDRKKADIIMELTSINAYKPITSMTVLELYDLIKLAINKEDLFFLFILLCIIK